ncbi:MAG: hypothetical protein Q4F95_16130 [Oscillospiraceae bacterium]|nr:hypothetical protein [Oscillospiraceae bacterium]
MNNLIRSEWFMFRKKSFIMTLFGLLTAYASLFFGGLLDDEKTTIPFSVESLCTGSTISISIVSAITGAAIAICYQNRTQLYEIMTGFKPSTIIFARTALFLFIFTLFFFIPASAVLLILNYSAEILQVLALVLILYLRFMLCTVFLSPFFKEGAWITAMSALVILIKPLYIDTDGSTEKFRSSLIGHSAIGQCSLLGEGITSDFVFSIIVSSIISCIICYFIGYFTLKMKYDLEPHPIG